MTIIITDNLLLAQIIRQNCTEKYIKDAFVCLQAVIPDILSFVSLIEMLGGFFQKKSRRGRINEFYCRVSHLDVFFRYNISQQAIIHIQGFTIGRNNT